MKALFVISVFAIALTACSCSVRSSLGNRMGGYIKAPGPNVKALIGPISTYIHEHTLKLKSSDIDAHASNVVTYNMLNGAHMSTARGLRRRRRTCRRATVKASKPITVTPIAFKPFEGLKELKFGKNYQRVLVEQDIRTPGQSMGKVTAMEGVRVGTDIDYTAALGWSYGTTNQLYNQVKYQSCKKILFWKKCSTKTKNVPRGFRPDEVQDVEKALHNPILTLLRNKLSDGRLLKVVKSTKAWKLPEGMNQVNQVQLLKSVSIEDTEAAIQSMTGSSVALSRELLMNELSFRIEDENGRTHAVEQKFRGATVDLKVFSSI